MAAAVIFDLDGTLVDSAGEIADALNAALAEIGLEPLSIAVVTSLIGRGVHVLVQRALAKIGAAGVDEDDLVRRFERRYGDLLGSKARLFPGVRAGLERLHAAGIPLAVVTNKPRLFTESLLERLGIRELFGALIAGDDGVRAKPHGDMLIAACRAMGAAPGETLMVGDSDNDVRAARAAGLPVWCVPYGYNEGRPPGALACDRMVDSLEELEPLLAEKR